MLYFILDAVNLTLMGKRSQICGISWQNARISFFSIVFNVVDISIDELFCLSTSGHAYKLHKSRPLTSITVIDVWNALPADVVDFTSLPI